MNHDSHFIPVNYERSRVVYALCGREFHARETVAVHSTTPTCAVCRQQLADTRSENVFRVEGGARGHHA